MRREHETVRAIRRLYTHVALHMLEDEAIHGESMAKTALVPVGKLDALVNPAKQVCRREGSNLFDFLYFLRRQIQPKIFQIGKKKMSVRRVTVTQDRPVTVRVENRKVRPAVENRLSASARHLCCKYAARSQKQILP